MRTRSVLYAAWLSGGASGGLEVVFSHVRRGSVDSQGYVVLMSSNCCIRTSSPEVIMSRLSECSDGSILDELSSEPF
jgi:hypothetical protein